MIRLSGLQKTFSLGGDTIHALDDVTLEIQEGEFVAVMGPSGSGKTTLMNVIGGLDRPGKGSAEVEGHDLMKLKDKKLSSHRNKTVGYVFQDFHLQMKLTAMENVELPLVFGRVRPAKRKKRAKAILSKVGLGKRAKHKPSELSGGQRQRVAIARAIVAEPKILLADEPTGNLDSKTGKEIMNLIKSLNRDDGLTVILVTHDEEMARYADRVVRIRDGKLTR